jgi:predicted transglutaminase-like cysteine proteinase
LLFASGFIFTALDLTTSQVSAQEFASLPETITNLHSIGGARPVPAWFDFCNRHPAECAVDTSEADHITLTPEIWATIVRINRAVNAEIRPVTDQDQWGVVDSWDFPDTGYGDCEDYQLLKRRRLVDAGLPRRALRMTVVLDELNEGHAVLKIRTDRGDLVLDNKRNAVLPWNKTGYVYIKREGHESMTWVSLGGAVASPTAVAATER